MNTLTINNKLTIAAKHSKNNYFLKIHFNSRVSCAELECWIRLFSNSTKESLNTCRSFISIQSQDKAFSIETQTMCTHSSFK